jgi:mono/diheme cytochrome c family protein
MRRLIARPALLLSVLALAAAGCGGGSDGGGSGGGGGGSEGGSGGDPAQVFANACGQCHTLAAADTNGSFGPNLDDLQPSADEVLSAIQQGPGPMPDNLVEGAEAQAVADYVAESAGS